MTGYRITPFDLEKATDQEIDSWYQLRLEHIREIQPDDPVQELEYMLGRINALNSTQESLSWAAWNGNDRMVAWCRAHVSKLGYRKHSAYFGIIVRTAHRRRGLGTGMLRRVLNAADHFGRTDLRAFHSERCSAAEFFLKRIGAENTSSSSWNQLKLEEIDDNLVSEWLKLPSNGKMRIRLEVWNDHYPEESLQEICDFYQTVTDYQRLQDGEEDSDVRLTPENIRSGDEYALQGGRKRLIIIAREEYGDRLIGLTEVLWNPATPEILKQGYTAVLPDCRGHGIGKRLKAAMIREIRQTIPEAEVIRTGNDDTRRAILGINGKLGFRHYMTNYGWELDVDRLRNYLNESNM